ncbi:hypothetical protein BO94DRAFT_228732 [Aspergillus sclerotioniger CBS 115572]|uniref:Uncharacterized protein n=1 Tax=Aspergillus sclerotioniger CBS 115572 TaxID=1450535 RepID=A0A317VNV3_9EURO|nr:hypothetical protein BO94DRAFT_228732 [Aspergillus sclerotioniger CBS 115572]PWY74532.1 hypothetical protein BO94DRAFT_228732 [Aspergillus sclerotioniger CBS 115572]
MGVVEALGLVEGGSDAHFLSDTRAAMGIAGAGNGRMAGNTLLPGDPAREATDEIITIIMPMPTATVISPVTILMSRLVLVLLLLVVVRIDQQCLNQPTRKGGIRRIRGSRAVSRTAAASSNNQSSMDRRSDAGGVDGLIIAAPRSDCVQIRRTVDGATMLAG